ncbi:hypothetical protein NL676_026129 [Syzygium grande]|nr:hypothetical protein NL676_026129 [Syzygium grande]
MILDTNPLSSNKKVDVQEVIWYDWQWQFFFAAEGKVVDKWTARRQVVVFEVCQLHQSLTMITMEICDSEKTQTKKKELRQFEGRSHSFLGSRIDGGGKVCKSWGKAVVGPYCWQEIDIEDWSKECCFPGDIDRMLRMLITRSAGSLRKLSVSGTGLHDDGIFSFIADHAGSVHTLRLPRSEITDPIVESIAGRLSTLSFLDLSYCNRIGAHALEAIGKNCKMLLGLCRNMHPVDTAGKSSLDDEAHAIAFTMSKLRRLEMSYHLVSTQSVLEIIYNCPELEFLDLRGCHHAELDEKFLKERYPKLKVLGPDVVDEYERNEWEDYSDFSDFSEYLAWEFVAEKLEITMTTRAWMRCGTMKGGWKTLS